MERQIEQLQAAAAERATLEMAKLQEERVEIMRRQVDGSSRSLSRSLSRSFSR